MLKHCTLLALAILCRASLSAQDVTVTFSATLNGVPTPLDSIWVQNITAGGDTMLYAPNNALVLDLNTGLDGTLPNMGAGLSMSQAMPNPFDGSTRFQVSVEDAGDLTLTVQDALGKVLASTRRSVGQGVHAFTYSGGPQGVLFVEARWSGQRAVQRLLNMNGGQQVELRYAGSNDHAQDAGRPKDGWFEWQLGDSLLYIVYASSPFGYILSAADGEIPQGPSTPLFELLPGIVCAEEPVVADIDGNVYPVVQIGSQCWMAANLKTTRFRDGSNIPNVTNNSAWYGASSPARCSFDNNPANDVTYGKLYNWWAAANPDICPLGWHVPTDVEWMILETLMGVPADQLYIDNYRGWAENAGGKMKTTGNIVAGDGLWFEPNNGASNESGFSGLPHGSRSGTGLFGSLGDTGGWWCTLENDASSAFARRLRTDATGISRSTFAKRVGHCIRCLRD